MAQITETLRRTVQTSAAAAQNLLPYEIPNNTAVYFRSVITGIDAAGNRAVYDISIDAKRSGGGAAAIGAKTTIHSKDNIGLAAAPTFAAVNEEVSIALSGKAATVIDWGLRTDVDGVTPPS